MLREEFEKRTGFYPTSKLYEIIEKYYNATDIDKDEFCKLYKKNVDGLAEKIQMEADKVSWMEKHEQERESHKAIEAKEAEIRDLKRLVQTLSEKLDKELEWKSRGLLSGMDQKRYEELEGSAGTKYINEYEAKDWIEEEFGFRKDLIQIITELKTYEVNKYNQLRQTETVIRKPVYNATDWNYIRFNVQSWQYEVINGQLEQYCD